MVSIVCMLFYLICFLIFTIELNIVMIIEFECNLFRSIETTHQSIIRRLSSATNIHPLTTNCTIQDVETYVVFSARECRVSSTPLKSTSPDVSSIFDLPQLPNFIRNMFPNLSISHVDVYVLGVAGEILQANPCYNCYLMNKMYRIFVEIVGKDVTLDLQGS